MGYYARQFLAEWEFEHIKVVERANREERARLLAEKCRDDAAGTGINKWALEIAAGGDLTRKLIKALKEAEFQVDHGVGYGTAKGLGSSSLQGTVEACEVSIGARRDGSSALLGRCRRPERAWRWLGRLRPGGR
jgi:hypothetical protein